MQRVTRLLSGPPSRGRWGALAVLGALGVSGIVLITQVGIAGGRFPELEVSASTAGALGPGDYREIKAQGLDKKRYYRISLDARGKPTETYEENGEARPLDASARRWVAEATKMSATPQHPQVPPHPRFEMMEEPRALIAAIAASPQVRASLGSPATPTNKPVNGNIRVSGAEGDADIEIEMQGPKGRAIFAVQAEMQNRAWTLQSVAAE